MACLLWWVEGEVEQPKKKKVEQYALGMSLLTQQVETDQHQASAASLWRDALIPMP